MAVQPVVMRAEDGKWLNVLGMQLKFLCTNNDSDGRYSSILNTVPKGLGAPPHQHPWDEAFYVIKGDVEFLIGDNAYTLHSGDYVLAPALATHSFTGLSDEEALMIGFESPGHSHHFFQEINDTVTQLPEDLHKMPDIGKRHDVRFM